jgi:hypothetical protein
LQAQTRERNHKYQLLQLHQPQAELLELKLEVANSIKRKLNSTSSCKVNQKRSDREREELVI